MSGGSFGYLARWAAYDLHSVMRYSTVVEMRDALADLPKAQAALDDTNLFLQKIDELQKLGEKLEGVWHAMEWWHSGDWGPDRVTAAAVEYEQTRGLVVDSWSHGCASTDPGHRTPQGAESDT